MNDGMDEREKERLTNRVELFKNSTAEGEIFASSLKMTFYTHPTYFLNSTALR